MNWRSGFKKSTHFFLTKLYAQQQILLKAKKRRKNNNIMRSTLSLVTLLVTVGSSSYVSALNFDTLDTPILDAFAEFICQSFDGPICTTILDNINGESTTTFSSQQQQTQSSGATVTDLSVAVACDLGLLDEDYCEEQGHYDKEPDKKDRDDKDTDNNYYNNLYGTTPQNEQVLTDGQILGLLCGDGGVATKEVCDALVGEQGTGGLVQSFCETGTLIPPGICQMVGIQSPASGGGTRRRKLRGRKA